MGRFYAAMVPAGEGRREGGGAYPGPPGVSSDLDPHPAPRTGGRGRRSTTESSGSDRERERLRVRFQRERERRSSVVEQCEGLQAELANKRRVRH